MRPTILLNLIGPASEDLTPKRKKCRKYAERKLTAQAGFMTAFSPHVVFFILLSLLSFFIKRLTLTRAILFFLTFRKQASIEIY